jgi:hypothetical protein
MINFKPKKKHIFQVSIILQISGELLFVLYNPFFTLDPMYMKLLIAPVASQELCQQLSATPLQNASQKPNPLLTQLL